MRTTQTLLFAAMLGLCGVTGLQNANADLQNIADNFGTREIAVINNTADRQKVKFTKDVADLSAYEAHARDGDIMFYSFCAEPSSPPLRMKQLLLATLSFSGGKSYNTAGNSDSTPGEPWALNNGVAWLYMQYATGQIVPQTDAEIEDLSMAIKGLILEEAALTGSYWDDNPYLQTIVQDSGMSQSKLWEDYIVGDVQVTPGYAVFIMQLDTVFAYPELPTIDYQDLLYIAPYTPNSEVPEPASILFWTLGSIGAVLSAKRRVQRAKCRV